MDDRIHDAAREILIKYAPKTPATALSFTDGFFAGARFALELAIDELTKENAYINADRVRKFLA